MRPIGVTEPLFKVIGLCWLHKLKDAALKLFAGHQFGMSSAGAEAISRLFQLDLEDVMHGILEKEDSINFFNSLERVAIVDGASLLGPEFASYTAGVYEAETVYAWDRPVQNSREFFRTCTGIIQGET